MDSDGEDAASDVPRLARAVGRREAPSWRFAPGAPNAAKGEPSGISIMPMSRSTDSSRGREIRSGNFSVIPAEQLRRIVARQRDMEPLRGGDPESPNSRTATLPINRARRIAGSSKMNIVSLVMHGLSAIAVHADVVATRAIVGSLVIAIAGFLAIATSLVLKFALHLSHARVGDDGNRLIDDDRAAGGDAIWLIRLSSAVSCITDAASFLAAMLHDLRSGGSSTLLEGRPVQRLPRA